MKIFSRYLILILISISILGCNNTKQAEKEYIKGLEEKNELIQQELNDLENAYDDAIKDNETTNKEIEETRKRINEKIKELEPEKPNGNDFFTIGSTEKEVLEVMGEPTSYQEFGPSVTLSYGLSSVTLENGKVKSYSNLGDNLKVRLKE